MCTPHGPVKPKRRLLVRIMRGMVRLLGPGAIVLATGLPVAAQSVPRIEVSGGYQFLNVSIEGESESFGTGWYADIAGNLNRMFGIVFEVGGNYRSETVTETFGGVRATATADLSIHEFMGGIRFNARPNPTVVPYAQLLAGGTSLSAKVSASGSVGGFPISFSEEDSQTNFGLQAGGGVNFMFTERVGVRVGVDYLRIFEEDSGANVFRFAAGVVVPFGG
jgi:opacity protein-like surface antigen